MLAVRLAFLEFGRRAVIMAERRSEAEPQQAGRMATSLMAFDDNRYRPEGLTQL